MQRYEEGSINKGTKTRTSRNQELYQDLGKTEKYTTFTDVSKIEAIDLEEAKKNYHTREGYHQVREYDFLEEKPKVKKDLEEFNYLYATEEKKNYDLNEVLKEARELREKDELERKRKLHNEKYNILESSREDLERFKQEVKKTIKPVENEKELEELIHTITSKEVREKIDQAQEKSLLSDLMATSNLEEVVQPITAKIEKIEKKEEPKEIENTIAKEIDKSFYTKSLDLSEEDFDLEETEVQKTPVILTILKLILSIAIIVAVGFGVYYFVMHY